MYKQGFAYRNPDLACNMYTTCKVSSSHYVRPISLIDEYLHDIDR